MNLFDISHITSEEAKVFKSDFWHVADYFAQYNETKDYIPNKTRLTHPEEMFKFMKFLTGNEKFDNIIPAEKGGPTTMFDAFEAAEKRGEAIGEARGAQQSTISHIRSLMESCNWTAKQAMDALKISVDEQRKYLGLL